jgi:hypothetical protein
MIKSHLILVNLSVLQLCLSLLLKRDDDQGNKDVDKEEGEDDEEDDVEDGHLDAEEWDRTLVLVCGGHRVLQDPKYKKKM